MIQLPRLLDKQFQVVARLHPVRLTATDKLEPVSTATMGLPYGDPAVGLRDFVELFDADGSKGIYRVEGINASNGERQTINLSHGIVTLEDYIMPPDAVLQGSIKAMLSAILAQQTDILWTLGDVEIPENETYTVNASNAIALQALVNVAALVPEYAFAYDQSTTPWVLHFRRREQIPSCECRLSRNMSNISVSFSTQDMCTRVTSALLPNGYMDADNIDEWRVIERELPVEDDTNPENAVALAAKYLEQHKHPTASIEIEAIDLAEQTGEDLDSLVLGRVCRVALPDWGAVYNHQIVSIYWADLIGKPQQKKLSLATRKKRTEIALAQAASRASNADRLAKQNYKHIIETDNSVLIQAERIALLAEEIELRATKNEVDGAVTRISNVEIALDAANARIDLKADRTEYNDLEKRVSSAEIAIDGANAAITLKADQSTVAEQGERLSKAEVAIDGANAAISLKASQTTVDALGERVSSAEIAIDGANSRIDLKADKIALQGYVTMEAFEALEGEVDNLFASDLIVHGGLTADSITAGYGDFDDIGFGLINGKNPDAWVNDIVSQKGYATTSWVTGTALTPYATQAWVMGKGFLTSADLSGYATQTWVGQQGYLTSSSLTPYATQAYVMSKVGDCVAKTALTTKEITYVYSVGVSKATTPPFYNANGTQVSGGVSYVSSVTYNTATTNVVVYA